MDVKRRQFSLRQQRALQSHLLIWLHAFVSVVAIVGLAVLFGAMLFSAGGHSPAWLVAVAIGGPILMALVSAIISWRLVAQKRRLQHACSAIPPRVSGDPMRCHICGGPLESHEQGVIRCRFCQGDNLVDRRVLARVGKRLNYVLEGYRSAVRKEAYAMSGQSLAAAFLTALAIPGLMIGVPIALIATFVLLLQIERPPNSALQYEIVEVDDAHCLALLDDDGRYDLGPGKEKLKAVRLHGKRMTSDSLIGACVFAGGTPGRVSRVYSTLAEVDNRLDVQLSKGSTTAPMTSICLCSRPKAEQIASSGSFNPSLAVGAGRVWWWADTSVRFRDEQLAGTEFSVSGTADETPRALVVDATHLYLIDYRVQRVPLNGGARQTLWDGGAVLGNTQRARRASGSVVFVQDGTLFRTPINGGKTVQIAKDVAGFDAEGSTIVYNSGGKLLKVDGGGPGQTLPATAPHERSPVALHQSAVFFVDRALTLTRRGAEGEVKQFGKTGAVPQQLWVVAGHSYWLLDGAFGEHDTLKRRDHASGRTVNVVPGARFGAVAVTERHVYWVAGEQVVRQTHSAQYK